jgi:small subunit ribosomal protein S9
MTWDDSTDESEEQDAAPETEATEPTEPEAHVDEEPAGVTGESTADEPADEATADEPSDADKPTPDEPVDESISEGSAADEPTADGPTASASKPEEAPTAERPGGDKPKKDVVPGADLEPIAIADEERELTAEERAAREAEEEERAAREAAAADDDDDEAITPRSVTVPADTRIQATGKRKSSVARVIVRAGDGGFQINDRGIEEYFSSSQHQALAKQPLVTSGYEGSVDVQVRVHGGGISGQAGAVRHGVARALTSLEPELRGDLKRRGMLTRDDRRKERKKAGLKKARKRPQFSKR